MTGQTWLAVGLAFLALFAAFHALVRRVTARRNELFAAMASRHGGKVVTRATGTEVRCAVALEHDGRAVTITEALTQGRGRGFDTDFAFETGTATDLCLELKRQSTEKEAFELRYHIDAAPAERAGMLMDEAFRSLVLELDRRLEGGEFALLCKEERFIVRIRGRVPNLEILEKIYELTRRLCDRMLRNLSLDRGEDPS